MLIEKKKKIKALFVHMLFWIAFLKETKVNLAFNSCENWMREHNDAYVDT